MKTMNEVPAFLVSYLVESCIPSSLGFLAWLAGLFPFSWPWAVLPTASALFFLASGLVPILSDINCYRSFSGRSDHCIFVPEGDSEATFKAIERLYRMNPSEFQSMREKGISVSNDFSFDKACARFEELLKSFLAPSYKNIIGNP